MFARTTWAPRSFRSKEDKCLTDPLVPTGIKQGVLKEPVESLTVPALAPPSAFSKSKSAFICDQHSFRKIVFAQALRLQKKETCNSHIVPLYIKIATFPLRTRRAL